MELLTDAAIYNQTDHLRNVSSSIMLGKPFKGGTGLCSLQMDNEALENSEFNTETVELSGNKPFMKMALIDDILTRKTRSHMFMPNLEK